MPKTAQQLGITEKEDAALWYRCWEFMQMQRDIGWLDREIFGCADRLRDFVKAEISDALARATGAQS